MSKKIDFIIKNGKEDLDEKEKNGRQTKNAEVNKELKDESNLIFSSTSGKSYSNQKINKGIPFTSQSHISKHLFQNNQEKKDLVKNKSFDINNEKKSIVSEVSFKTNLSNLSQLNLNSNLSTFSQSLPKCKKNEKGKYLKEEHIVKTLYRKKVLNGSLMSKDQNKSDKSDIFSRGSKISYPNNSTEKKDKMNQNMNVADIIQVKREAGVKSPSHSIVRKRVCRKIYSILTKECKVETKMARNLSLALELRINSFYPENPNSKTYIKVIKNIFDKIRVRLFFLNDLGRKN